MSKKSAIVICDKFVNEVKEVIKGKEEEYDLIVYEAKCHLPRKMNCTVFCHDIHRKKYKSVHVFSSGCIKDKEEHSELCKTCSFHPRDMCLNMIARMDRVNEHLRQGAFLVSPGWLAKWRTHLEDWGLADELAEEFFNESANKILLLDTQVDPESLQNLKDISEAVKLPYEVDSVGLAHFREFVIGSVH